MSGELQIQDWNDLVSESNWRKGEIIAKWWAKQGETGTPPTDAANERFAQTVGGITAAQVQRLHRVHYRFSSIRHAAKYHLLRWAHFYAALEWDDALNWLATAQRSDWSVADMRKARWESIQ